MKKRLLFLLIGLVSPLFIMATSFVQLNTDLNDIYEKHSLNLSNVYKDSLNDYDKLVNELKGTDYVALGKIENIDTTNLKKSIGDEYLDLKKEIYSKKSELELNIELLKEKEEYNLITEQEGKDLEDSLALDISSYDSKYTIKIDNLRNTLLSLLSDYKKNLDTQILERKDDLDKITNFDSKLSVLTENYKKLKDDYSNLENITNISEDIIENEGNDIKQKVLDLLKNRLTEKYNSYIKKDPDFVYYKKDFEKKEQMMEDYMEGQINTFWLEQMQDIYKGVNMADIENKYLKIEIYNGDYDELLENYDKVMSDIAELNTKIFDSLSIFENTIKDYSNNGNINNQSIKIAIQKETIEYFESIFDKIKLEMDTFFQTSFEILTYRKEVEKEKYNQIVADYNKILLDKQDKEIENMKKEIEKFDNTTAISQKVINKNKIMLWKLELALIDSKIVSLGLTNYLTKYGDLSDVVYKFLLAKKQEYENNGKAEIFVSKVNKAYEKIKLMEQGLKKDRLSFYILMIKKGIILYYMG